jgi:hypothetical protein
MSGTFCGGCGEGNLLPDSEGKGKRPVKCDVCGWTADRAELLSEWLDGDNPPWTKRERKEAGRLFFLWIDATGEGLDRAMRLLGRSSYGVAPHALVELESRPSEEMPARLRDLPGVTRVWMAP